jgi:hypothetical protein
MFKIYSTSGSYPNLSLNEELFEHMNVNVNGDTQKTIEDDIIPLEAFPDAWDSYTVNKNITVTGIFTNDNIGSYTNVAVAWKELDKIMMDYGKNATWTDQPDFNDIEDRDVLAFVFYIPNGDSTDTTITFYGVLTGFKWNFEAGAPHINYDLSFKCFARKWIL